MFCKWARKAKAMSVIFSFLRGGKNISGVMAQAILTISLSDDKKKLVLPHPGKYGVLLSCRNCRHRQGVCFLLGPIVYLSKELNWLEMRRRVFFN